MKKIVLIVLVLTVVYFLGARYSNGLLRKDNGGTQIVTTTKSDIEKIMEEENFKKATILRARKVANDKKKEIEVERNKQAMNSIESEYEAIRAEELALVGVNGGTTTSLK